MSKSQAGVPGPNPILGVHREMEPFVEITDSVMHTPTPERRLLHNVVSKIVPQEVVGSHDLVAVRPGEPFPLDLTVLPDHVAVSKDEIGVGVRGEGASHRLEGPWR